MCLENICSLSLSESSSLLATDNVCSKYSCMFGRGHNNNYFKYRCHFDILTAKYIDALKCEGVACIFDRVLTERKFMECQLESFEGHAPRNCLIRGSKIWFSGHIFHSTVSPPSMSNTPASTRVV